MDPRDMVGGKCYSIQTNMSSYPYHIVGIIEHNDEYMHAYFESILFRGQISEGAFEYSGISSVEVHND